MHPQNLVYMIDSISDVYGTDKRNNEGAMKMTSAQCETMSTHLRQLHTKPHVLLLFIQAFLYTLMNNTWVSMDGAVIMHLIHIKYKCFKIAG